MTLYTKSAQWYELRPGAWLARTGAARRARLCRCTEPKSGFVQDWCDENQIGFRGIAWHGSVAQDPHLHRWRERAPGRLSGHLGPAPTLTSPTRGTSTIHAKFQIAATNGLKLVELSGLSHVYFRSSFGTVFQGVRRVFTLSGDR